MVAGTPVVESRRHERQRWRGGDGRQQACVAPLGLDLGSLPRRRFGIDQSDGHGKPRARGGDPRDAGRPRRSHGRARRGRLRIADGHAASRFSRYDGAAAHRLRGGGLARPSGVQPEGTVRLLRSGSFPGRRRGQPCRRRHRSDSITVYSAQTPLAPNGSARRGPRYYVRRRSRDRGGAAPVPVMDAAGAACAGGSMMKPAKAGLTRHPAVLIAAAILTVGVIVCPETQAAEHLMSVQEVFPGTLAAPDAQYVMLRMTSSGQTLLNTHYIAVEDPNGVMLGRFGTFDHNMGNGGAVCSWPNCPAIVMGTSAAQTLFGFTFDQVVDAQAGRVALPLTGGRVCFRLSSNNAAMDCVAYGSYSAANTIPAPTFNGCDANFGTPAAALARGFALTRTGFN